MMSPEGIPRPPNVSAELQRNMERLRFVVSQIREIEEARQNRLEQDPATGPYAMVRLLARVVGIGGYVGISVKPMARPAS
jgi:transposase